MGIFRKLGRFFARRFGRRPKKAMVRRGRKRRGGLRKAVNRPFMVKKTFMLDRITIVAGTTSYQVLTAELTDVPGYTNYTALYDKYKINKVTVRYRMLNPVNVITSTNGLITLGMVHSVVDTNDSNTPGSIQQLMNDSSYYGTKSNKDHVRSWKPKFLLDVGGNAAAKTNSGYLSCDYPNVSHYALKTAFEPGAAPANFTSFIVEPIITYYVSFKDQRN